MHLGIPPLLEFFRRHRGDDCLAVATIIGTEGSTYRKTGAMMLAAPDGAHEGLISGGCLESDLMHHMLKVIEDGRPRWVEYDMHAGDDLVWNLGIGCDGMIRLFLQPLGRDDGFGFLGPLAHAQAARRPAVIHLAVEEGELPAGSWRLRWGPGENEAAGDARLEAVASPPDDDPDWRTRWASWPGPGGQAVMQLRVPAPVRVLICGAGPDAVPLANAFAQLDWEVVVTDHRAAFAKPGRFAPGCTVRCARPGEWGDEADPGKLDAAVIMSHHLENDSRYLAALKDRGLAYLGVLGPRARRGRLAEMAGCAEESLFGPVGLDIGAELPAAIALSVAAEVHAVLNGRDGRSLSRLARAVNPE